MHRAAELVLEGHTGFMPAIERIANEPYQYKVVERKLSDVANKARAVPREWINEEGNDVTGDFLDYVRPLVSGEVDLKWKDGLPVYLPVGHLNHGNNGRR